MSLKEKLDTDLKQAMRDKDKIKLNCIRAIRTELLKKEKEKKAVEINDDAILEIINRLVKQRRESIEMFEKGGRTEMAANEKIELAILEQYLPEALTEEEINTIVAQVIEATGASSLQDIGKVMGQVMGHAKKPAKPSTADSSTPASKQNSQKDKKQKNPLKKLEHSVLSAGYWI